MNQDTKENARLILNDQQIRQKIRRIAYEIYERNFYEENLIIAGIADRGYYFASQLCRVLEEISSFQQKRNNLFLVKVSLEKFTNVQTPVELDFPLENLNDQCIILADDVLNSGKTLAYGLQPFLKTPVKKIETAVLVNRSHRLFPVFATYTGYELATTLQNHIKVVMEENNYAAYLK